MLFCFIFCLIFISIRNTNRLFTSRTQDKRSARNEEMIVRISSSDFYLEYAQNVPFILSVITGDFHARNLSFSVYR